MMGSILPLRTTCWGNTEMGMHRRCLQLPLFEDGTAPRILVTEFDRIEDIDTGLLFRYVATVGVTPRWYQGKLGALLISTSLQWCVVRIFQSFMKIKKLSSGILVPSFKVDDLRH